MREVRKQPFQRPSHNHPKRNFISKKIFQNFVANYVWTWSSMREVRWQPFQRLGHNFVSKKIFQNFVLNYVWTWSSMREVCKPFQRFCHNHSKKKKKTFFQKLKIKTFFCVNLGKKHLFCIKHIINFLCKHV